MDRFAQVKWCLLLLVLFCQIATAKTPIHHNLDVILEPEKGYLEARDTLTLPEAVKDISFSLQAKLKLRLETPGARVVSTLKIDSFVPIKQYKVRFSTEQKQLKLHYSGKIEPRRTYRPQNYSKELEANSGIISKQGVFLSLSSFWFPVVNHDPVVFTLSTSLPDGWTSVSQGKSISGNRWLQSTPQDDIYLIAGKYHIYKQSNDVAEAQVYLRQPNKKLAQRYLKVTGDYLQLYSKLLGPYPYPKFALVENFWESGYGMPSFTLLGSRVIRLPFILHSSYPHEILHNWWGNGVFVDYSKGNWSEGIASYLADHLIKEQRGQGSNYRRDTLQRYADYVSENSEYSLKDFRGYHGHASQAIGYGKTMMFLHMLKQHLGDETFLEGLRLFYKDNLYKLASYDDMQKAMEHVSNKNLSTEFLQWTSRIGAPKLEIANVSTEKKGWWDYRLSFTLRQIQKEKPYLLHVPVYVQIEDESEPVVKTITFDGRETTRTIKLDDRPVAVSADPLFDLFRQLDKTEIPSSLGQLFATEDPLIILPSQTDIESRKAYRQLANSFKQISRKTKITWDNKIDRLPKDKAIWLFGHKNLLAEEFLESMNNMPVSRSGQTVKINNKEFAVNENSFVLTNRTSATRGWLHCHSLAAFKGLARKIPHYRKYSYLAFTGDNPDNILKGQWPMNKSKLNIKLDSTEPSLDIKEHKPLSDLIE